MEYKQLRRAVLVAVCLCLLAGCGKKDKEETPEETSNLLAEYPVGEQTVAALTTEESGVTMDSVVTYTYSGLSSAGTTAQDYAGQLRGSPQPGWAAAWTWWEMGRRLPPRPRIWCSMCG